MNASLFRNSPSKTLLAALAAATFALPARAEDAVTLDPVNVTATRSPVASSAVNAAVTVISREELVLLQANDVGEAIAQVAGIDVIRGGGIGQSPTSIFIRGAESNHTLVLVDGVRLNDGINGLAALEDIPLESIERIEIVKGPRSNQWGSDAIGGVIHIITRKAAQQGFSGEVAARYGRYSTSDASGTVGYRAGRGGVQLSLERQDSEGYPTFKGAKINAGHENLAGSLAGDLKLGSGTLNARHWQADGETEYLGSATASKVNRYEFTRRTSTLGWTGAITDRWTTSLDLQLAGDEREEQQLGFGTRRDFYETERKGVDWQNDVALGAHQLTLGANYSEEDTRASASDAAFDRSTKSQALFAQDAIRLGRLSLLVSGRYTEHDSYGGNTTAAIDYGFAITSALTAGIGYGTAFRAPNASERFLSFPAFFFFANPNLEPETSKNLEASLKARIDETQTVAVHLFQNRIDNLISTKTDPATFRTTYVNVDRAKITGVELDYRLVQGAWNLSLNANAQKAEDETTGQRLLRRASKSLTAQLGRQIGAHRVGVQLQAVGERPDMDFSSFPSRSVSNGGYGLVTLLGEAQLLPRLTFGARVENLLDHHYTTVFGYRQSGVAAYGTLRYKF